MSVDLSEAEKILKPKTFRVKSTREGFSVEESVVSYWDAVHALAEALAGEPVPEPTVFVCRPDGTGGFDMPAAEYDAAVARQSL